MSTFAHLPDKGEGSIAARDGWVEASYVEGWLSHLGQIHAGDFADRHGCRHLQQTGNSEPCAAGRTPNVDAACALLNTVA